MKKEIVITILVGLLVGAGLMYFFGPARFPNQQRPALPTSFHPVTAKLDAGGDIYAYMSTERLIRSLEELGAKFAQKMPGQPGGAEKAWLSFVIRLLRDSGLNEISGVGLSNVAVSPELQRSTFVVHHYADKGQGLIWLLGGNSPRPLAELDLLPADTALAFFGEFRLEAFWNWLKKELEGSGIPGAVDFARQAEPQLAAQGVQLPKLLASLSGTMGYFATLDKERKVTLPGGEGSLSIPEPSLALVIGVKDGTLFELLKSKLPMAAFSEKGGRKTLQFPAIPAPIPLEPCFTWEKGWLIVASTPRLADAVLKPGARDNGLRESDEFASLARYVPDRGNGFNFVSSRLWRIYADLLAKTGGGKENEAMQFMLSLFPKDLRAFSVVQRGADGVVWTVCHNVSPELIVLLPVASVAGIASAVAIPNLLQATEKGKQKRTMGDLKSAGMAIESYLTDYAKSPDAAAFEDLRVQLEPFHIKTLPLKDAWGHPFLYVKSGTDGFKIASPGKDGIFLGWQQQGAYPAGQAEQDIIFANGQFVYGPDVR